MSRINLVTVKKDLSSQVSSLNRNRGGASINLPVQAFGPYEKRETGKGRGKEKRIPRLILAVRHIS